MNAQLSLDLEFPAAPKTTRKTRPQILFPQLMVSWADDWPAMWFVCCSEQLHDVAPATLKLAYIDRTAGAAA